MHAHTTNKASVFSLSPIRPRLWAKRLLTVLFALGLAAGLGGCYLEVDDDFHRRHHDRHDYHDRDDHDDHDDHHDRDHGDHHRRH